MMTGAALQDSVGRNLHSSVDSHHQSGEKFCDVSPVFCRRFHEGAVAHTLCSLQPFRRLHLPSVLQVAFVAHQNRGHFVPRLHLTDLLEDVLCLFKRRSVVDGIDQREGLAVCDVKLPHGGELFGAGGVQNLHNAGAYSVHVRVVPVVVFDSGVVGRREDARDYSQRERALSHSSGPQQGHFVLRLDWHDVPLAFGCAFSCKIFNSCKRSTLCLLSNALDY